MTTHLAAPGCSSKGNRHSLELLDRGIFYARCADCGVRFYLISEPVYTAHIKAMQELGIELVAVERPVATQ